MLRILVMCCLLFVIFFPQTVYAVCDNSLPVERRGADCPAGLDQIEFVFRNVITVIAGLGFIAMLVMLISAGIQYLTSGGEPKAVQQAHFTVTWALLGVLFMAIAWIILLLIKTFTGIDVTFFDVNALCLGPKGPLEFCLKGP